MPAKLYVVPGSHPSRAVEKALELKGLEFDRIDLVPVYHKLAQRLRFGGAGTVPGVRFDDGTKVLGSRAIVQALEQRSPEPSLYPAERRAEVEQAERWGDEVLQPLTRRLIWWGLGVNRKAQLSYLEDAKLSPPVPGPLRGLSGAPVAWIERRMNGVREQLVRDDLRELHGHLDRIDGWIADGLLDVAHPNAADLQIGSSVRLLLTLADLDALFSGRPCAEHARQLFPRYPGRVPSGALPAA
jgi:glutathione S-transferase